MNTPGSSVPLASPRFPTFASLGPSAGRWFGRGLLLATGLMVLYALSIGPAIRLNKRGLISPGTLEVVYFPLSIAADLPGVHWLLDRYLALWENPESGDP